MITRTENIKPRLVCATLALAWLLAAPGTAFADNKKAAGQKFKEGVELYKAEKFEEALEAFLASNELYPHPDTLVNIANCYAELYEFANAMKYFDMYVEQKGDDLTSAQKKEIQNKMERVGKKVGKLTFKPEDLEGELIVDGTSIGSLPLDKPLYLEAGLHQVVLKEENEIFYSKQVNIIGGAKTVVDVDLEEMEEEDAEIEEEEEGEEVEKPAKPKKPKKKKKGAIRITVEGEETGVVLINGAEEGETPLDMQLKEGYYMVSVQAPDKPTWEGEVPVESEKHTDVKIDFNSTKKVPNVNNPMFWSGLGVMLPTLASGIAFSLKSKDSNDAANILYDQIILLETSGRPVPPDLVLRQNEWVDKGDEEKKAAIAFYVISGVGAAAAVASIFIFRKEKAAAKGTFEISGVSPIINPADGSIGVGMQGSF